MTAERTAGTGRDDRGFALLAVMLVLSLLGVIAAEFAFSMRLEASMVRAFKEGIVGGHLAEAAVQQGIREILSPSTVQGLDEDGRLVFYRPAPGQGTLRLLPALARERVPYGPGEFSYRITDEESRINVNTAPPERVDRLLDALGLDKGDRDVINDSLQDWKDSNDNFRANGAESEDYYLKLPVPYRARNANLQDVAELLQIKGVTPALYHGVDRRPGLADLATIRSRNQVNLNTASRTVLKALGFSDAEVIDVMQSRGRTPYAFVPGRFAGRGLAVSSQTFRIEAEGRVAGQPPSRIVAIVQRSAQAAGGGRLTPGAPPSQGVTVLSWRRDPDRERPAPAEPIAARGPS
ncbi:MAG: general secretion pathway protein GspK [Candidatus Rokubacteria bacterium]|nr:general secretion pathway protein GspK [Candidatus Rokubacteria bacterium]